MTFGLSRGVVGPGVLGLASLWLGMGTEEGPASVVSLEKAEPVAEVYCAAQSSFLISAGPQATGVWPTLVFWHRVQGV